jgi:hypothetical protein
MALDRATIRALAYAAALGEPAFALHISPASGEADRFLGYWQAWGDHLPLEVIVSPHRAVVAPLVNYIWTLHRPRPDLTLTVAVPELVHRHWWHRTLYEHIAERLQRGGRFRLAPAEPGYVSKQLYLPGSAVLITRFMAPGGLGVLRFHAGAGRRG